MALVRHGNIAGELPLSVEERGVVQPPLQSLSLTIRDIGAQFLL
jgi:hypothetical protein